MKKEASLRYEVDLARYKKIIDEDFKIFGINSRNKKRFLNLEKSWIATLSHNVMPSDQYFIHEDRKQLRDALLAYLNQKIWYLSSELKKVIVSAHHDAPSPVMVGGPNE